MTAADGHTTRRIRPSVVAIGVGVVAVLIAVGLHFWSHTWSPNSSDLAGAISDVAPEDWALVDESRHDGDIFRFCIDDTCPRATHDYLAAIEPDGFIARFSDRLSDIGYEVAAADSSGECRLPANVSPDSSFPLCRFSASSGDVALRFVLFSPVVADRRFPGVRAEGRHLIAVEATPD